MSFSSLVAIITGILTMLLALLAYIFNLNELPDNYQVRRAEIYGFYATNNEGNLVNLVKFLPEDSKDTVYIEAKPENVLNYKPNKKSGKIEIYVAYNKSNPQAAIIYDKYFVWGVPLSVAIIGLFIVIFGLLLKRYELKTRI